MRASNVGVWEVTLPYGELHRATLRSNVGEQLGYGPRHSQVALASVLDLVHPDDRDRLAAAERSRFGETSEPVELEVRVRHRDCSYRWLLVRGTGMHEIGGELRLVGTTVDLTEQKRIESELRFAVDAAEAASRAKDELLANVSHEIRTPMNAILGMTELAIDAAPNEDQRRPLLTIRSSAEALLAIVDDLLDFRKIEVATLELERADFSLRPLLDDTLRALAPLAHRKRLELACNVAPDVPDALVGDAGRLRQVLTNLVGNAIKFTERGEVVVDVVASSVLDEELTIHVTVRDTGIGIARDKQALVFRPFEQGDRSTTRKYGGTGLGLTIAARLVALMSGSLTVESEPGRGSSFRFDARLARQPESTRVVGSAPETNPRDHAPIDVAPLRILVAEDNELNSELVETLLLRRGHSVHVASSGQQALSVLETSHFDLLLLDLHMPELDGFEVIEHLRGRERSTERHLPVIALSARSRPEDRARCLAAGMDELISKPIRVDVLLRTIERLVASPFKEPASLIAAPVLLAAVGNEPTLLDRIRAQLVLRVPHDLLAIEAALDEANAPKLREAAHFVCGLVAAFSPRVSRLAAAIEDHAAAGDLTAAATLVGELRTLLPRLLEQVTRVSIESLEHAAQDLPGQ